jgi:hypothetical protein
LQGLALGVKGRLVRRRSVQLGQRILELGPQPADRLGMLRARLQIWLE